MEDYIRRQMELLLPRLHRFALALTAREHEADDLLQMTCERALSRSAQWNPDTRLDSWMFRIMQTIWFNELRARQVRARHKPELEHRHATSVDGEQHAEARALLRRVHEEIARLPEEHRVVLLLVCVEGLSYREASEVTSTPIGTVMSRLARARLALMRRLEGTEEAPLGNLIQLRGRS